MADTYKCEDCGAIFDHSEIVWKKDRVGEFGGCGAYQEFGFCPECGSDSFDFWQEPEDEEEDEE